MRRTAARIFRPVRRPCGCDDEAARLLITAGRQEIIIVAGGPRRLRTSRLIENSLRFGEVTRCINALIT